jgi:hypothetical protein
VPPVAAIPERRQKVSDCWKQVDALVEAGVNLGLYGPPGTGKSHVASHGARGYVASVTVTPEMPAAALVGHFVPAGDRFRWLDGPAVTAWEQGGRLVVNELTRAGEDVLTVLLAITDDPRSPSTFLTLPVAEDVEGDVHRGRVVRPREGFQFIGTMNGEPDELEEALVDRLIWVRVDRPNPKAFRALPTWLRPVARSFTRSEDFGPSLRPWFKLAALLEREVEADLALEVVFPRRLRTAVAEAMAVRGLVGEQRVLGETVNPAYREEFGSWEDLPAPRGYCAIHGYEHASEDEDDWDSTCLYARFTSHGQAENFLAEFRLAPSDLESIVRVSLTIRTRTTVLSPEAIDVIVRGLR